MAVVGFAAFSPGVSTATEDTATTIIPAPEPDVSARVASAVLALRVTESESRIATTVTAAPAATTTTVDSAQAEASTTTTAPETTTTTEVAEAADTSDEPEAAESSDATLAAAPAPTAASTTTKPRDTTAPKIKVTSHGDGDAVTSRIVTFSGTSEAGAKVTSGPFDATMSDNGNWTIKLAVVDGANGAKFTATDKAGNSASTRIVVNYDEPSSSPTTTKASPTTTKASTTTTKAAATTTTKATTTTTKASTSS